MSPNAGGEWGCGVSANENSSAHHVTWSPGVSANENSCAHHVTWSPNKLGDLTPYLTCDTKEETMCGQRIGYPPPPPFRQSWCWWLFVAGEDMVPEPPLQAQAAGQGEGHDGHGELSAPCGRTGPCQGQRGLQMSSFTRCSLKCYITVLAIQYMLWASRSIASVWPCVPKFLPVMSLVFFSVRTPCLIRESASHEPFVLQCKNILCSIKVSVCHEPCVFKCQNALHSRVSARYEPYVLQCKNALCFRVSASHEPCLFQCKNALCSIRVSASHKPYVLQCKNALCPIRVSPVLSLVFFSVRMPCVP